MARGDSILDSKREMEPGNGILPSSAWFYALATVTGFPYVHVIYYKIVGTVICYGTREERVTDLIDWMKQCSGYSKNFCDEFMCPECNWCDRNLAVEYHKEKNICVKCHGMEVYSRFIFNTTSATRLCNQCGGTGRFY